VSHMTLLRGLAAYTDQRTANGVRRNHRVERTSSKGAVGRSNRRNIWLWQAFTQHADGNLEPHAKVT
jgi:hypothetical protein